MTIMCPFCKTSISRPEEKKTDVKFANAIMPETVTDGVKTYTIPESSGPWHDAGLLVPEDGDISPKERRPGYHPGIELTILL